MGERYTVRLLSPDGQYPSESIRAEAFAVLGVDDLVWSAVHSPYDDEHIYPEGSIAWLSFDEVRFFAAVSLAEPDPHLRARPWIISKSWSTELVLDERDGPEVLYQRSRETAEQLSAREPLISHVRDRPRILDRDYSKETMRMLHAIGTGADRLLHRGLYKFLMATELRRFPHLLEEMALTAFVSREAALELLRRKLSRRKAGRQSRQDVLDQIRGEFPYGGGFTDVLESDWEARVMMVHPVNEFGEYWSPPVHAEECYDALHTLTYLYRYLLLDEVWDPLDETG